MGMIHAEIELINGGDVLDARRHIIGEEEIRRMHVMMLVNSGSFMMAINENIQACLGFPIVEERRPIELANGKVVTLDVVGPVDVRFANRKAMCSAVVLPGDSEPLLGAIPMEEMDVLIHPKRQELVVNPMHPDAAILRL